MKRLERLGEIANRQLSGLEAKPELLARIRQEAAQRKTVQKTYWKPVLACAMALVLLVGGLMILPKEPVVTDSLITSHSAGVQNTEVPAIGDLPPGSLNMTAGVSSRSDSLFAPATGSTFPLIIVDGATYRLLTSPNGISSGLLGDELGTVSEFNMEPALGSGDIISNVVGQGETVCAVRHMNGGMVAAPVDGNMRVFQRISYAGKATLGNETLADTLCSADDVSWIFISGLGTVSGGDAVELMSILFDCAEYQSTGMSGNTSMQIGLNNGLVLQLTADNDCVSACGTWSCPEFFEGFHEAVGY